MDTHDPRPPEPRLAVALQLPLPGGVGRRTATRSAWRLDEATRETGRRGVALARAALREARRRTPAGDDAGHATAA